jgi:hypothetical protein
MSLNYDITDVKDIHWDFVRKNLYNFTVLMMVTGTHALNGEADARKFQYRLRLYQRVAGTDWTDLLESADKFIGTSTNVGQETDGEFKRRMVKLLTDRTEREHVKFLRLLSEPTSSV